MHTMWVPTLEHENQAISAFPNSLQSFGGFAPLNPPYELLNKLGGGEVLTSRYGRLESPYPDLLRCYSILFIQPLNREPLNREPE